MKLSPLELRPGDLFRSVTTTGSSFAGDPLRCLAAPRDVGGYVSVRTDSGIVFLLASSRVVLVTSGSSVTPDAKTELEDLDDVLKVLGDNG